MGFDNPGMQGGGMQSGAGSNSYQVGPNPNIPQGDMRQGGLAAQYGWGGPSAYGWGGPYGSQSWGGWNQASQSPGQLGGLMGGASSGFPWMQFMQPFMQYMQSGGVNAPGGPGGGSPAGAPPPTAGPWPSNPSSHFSTSRLAGGIGPDPNPSPGVNMRTAASQALNQRSPWLGNSATPWLNPS